MTPSIALTSMRLRSLALMVAFCFFVPKVSPRVVFASRYSVLDGAAEGTIDFRALTVWVRICGDLEAGRMEIVPVFVLRTASRYLIAMTALGVRENLKDQDTYRHPASAALRVSSSLVTNSTLSVSPATKISSSSSPSFPAVRFDLLRE